MVDPPWSEALKGAIASRGLGESVRELVEGAESLPAPDPLPRAHANPRMQLERGDDPLNALVRRADVRAAVPEGPLEGLRVSLKDSIAIAGIELSCGSSVFDRFVPSGDATVTKRLIEAGASLVAVTNMDDLAFSGGGDTGHFGPVLNPHDSHRLAGGSSGGAAASLFYEGIDAAIGTDQGGSVRVPASWCGVVGLKPTHGLIPYTGVIGMEPTLDHIGVLARDVSTVERITRALAGPDGLDPRQQCASDGGVAVGAKWVGTRIRVLAPVLRRSDPEVRHAIQGVITDWAERGVDVEGSDIDPAAFGPISTGMFVEGALATLLGLAAPWDSPAFFWEEMHTALREGVERDVSSLSSPVLTGLAAAMDLQGSKPGVAYGRARNRAPQLVAAIDGALQDVDFLAMPTSPCLPLRRDDSLSDEERTRRGWSVLANTGAFNVTGHPAISLPVARADGLPVGLMLVGRRRQDYELLAFARRMEHTFANVD